MPVQSLTPYERETVILLSDGDGTARISTHQRRVLTKLRRHPQAVEIDSLRHGSTDGATFELPAACVSFRTSQRGHPRSAAQQAASLAAGARLRAVTQENAGVLSGAEAGAPERLTSRSTKAQRRARRAA